MVLDYEVRDRIAFIAMNRPEAMNAMNEDLKQKLRAAIEEVDRDPEVWVAIVTGAGDKAFSAGGDLKEYVTRELEGPGQPYSMFKHYDQPMSVKPFIAAVERLLPRRRPGTCPCLRHQDCLRDRIFRMPGAEMGIASRLRGNPTAEGHRDVRCNGDAVDRRLHRC